MNTLVIANTGFASLRSSRTFSIIIIPFKGRISENDGGDSLDYIESLQLGKNDLAILSPVTYDIYSLKESGQT